ncbi:hypothetical protein RJ640_007298 [Escallonia rubra]|uniref:mRNA-decapping enzyme-like protein n=1 Tax=Escallonia rubra TaxID=112253 RepID=A0AA88R0W6_9ASTE|nr:hypothetical protein RJ640_007298 [Escallonia rubra]
MSQNGKLMPNLDHNSTKLLNLTVLQRIDPFVEEILITAAHVTFYEFNIDLSQWSRKDVEGSLFVVKRNTQPRFQFIVMNRRNTDNLVENLLGDFEYEIQVPYLLYRNAAQEVNGIWFYNARECEEVANLFSRGLFSAHLLVCFLEKGQVAYVCTNASNLAYGHSPLGYLGVALCWTLYMPSLVEAYVRTSKPCVYYKFLQDERLNSEGIVQSLGRLPENQRIVLDSAVAKPNPIQFQYVMILHLLVMQYFRSEEVSSFTHLLGNSKKIIAEEPTRAEVNVKAVGYYLRILSAYAKVPTKPKLSATKRIAALSVYEFAELEPTMAVMDGPLEPSSSATSNTADVPDDPSFMNFFNVFKLRESFALFFKHLHTCF